MADWMMVSMAVVKAGGGGLPWRRFWVTGAPQPVNLWRGGRGVSMCFLDVLMMSS